MWIPFALYAVFMVAGGMLCVNQLFHQASIVFLVSTISPGFLINWDKVKQDHKIFFWVSTSIGILGFMTGAIIKIASYS
jgi:hypothetical protein